MPADNPSSAVKIPPEAGRAQVSAALMKIELANRSAAPQRRECGDRVVDAVLELPSAQVQLGQAVVRRAPECAARPNALQGLGDVDQGLEGSRPQLGRYVDILCKVNRVRHAKYFAMSGLSHNTPGSVVFAFAHDLGSVHCPSCSAAAPRTRSRDTVLLVRP